jgi:WD40 repeat protein
MSARLAQARERLRQRLARRGFVAPAAGIATLLTAAAAEAALPLPLVGNTVRAAAWFVGAEAGSAGCVSSRAVALARGAGRAMFMHKLRIAGAVLLAAAMLGTGATLLLRAAPQDDPPAPTVPQPSPESRGERLPQGAVARMGTTRLRHGDAISFAAYTPDGRALVTAGRDRTVRLWDLATGQEIRRFDWGTVQPDTQTGPGEEGILQRYARQLWDDVARSSQAALSADGKLVAASRGGIVCQWETATGKQLRAFHTREKRLDQLAFSADGKSLLTLGPGQAVAVWEVATGTCVRRSQGQLPAGFGIPSPLLVRQQVAVVSPGFKYLAFLGRDASDLACIVIQDLATGKEVARIDAGTIVGTSAMAFSPDDKTLVWDHNWGDALVVSDAATGKELRRLGGDDRCRTANAAGRVDRAVALALSADGKSLAVTRTSHTIELLDLASGKQIRPVGKATDAQLEQRFTDDVGTSLRPALAFAHDGKKLACSLGDATIRQFQVDTGAEIPGPSDGHRAPVSTLALSADGKTLVTYSHGDPVHFWDWATGRETGQRQLRSGATHIALAADGGLACTSGFGVTLLSADGKKTQQIATGNGPPLTALALSPDGALLATRAFRRPQVRLWDTTTAKERETLGLAVDAPVFSGDSTTETTGVVPPDLVFSPDGRWLAGAGASRQLCLWDAATGSLLWELPPQAGQAIERFAFSPNGRSLGTVHADGTVTLYEAATGARRCRLGEADPNRRRIHLISSSDGLVESVATRWDVPVCLAFSPDGRYLATAQETPEVHLWDVLAGKEVGQLKGHEGGVVSLLFALDSKHLLSGGTDTTALTWDLTQLTHTQPAPAPRLQPPALDALWTDLAGQDAVRAFDAIRKLSASPDQAVLLLRERVRPATPADPKRLTRLLADLQSDRFELRRRAESELGELSELAEPALRQALADEPPPDLRQRVQRLLDRLSGVAPPAGLVRDWRAVEVLELIGTMDAQGLLHALAGGVPGARLTREAKGALQRLTR